MLKLYPVIPEGNMTKKSYWSDETEVKPSAAFNADHDGTSDKGMSLLLTKLASETDDELEASGLSRRKGRNASRPKKRRQRKR
jgi:hypothetical protein